MKIQTSRFGALEIKESDIIIVVGGVLGFPEHERFVIMEHDTEGSPFKWLQAVDNADLAFVIIDPRLLVEQYIIEVDAESQKTLGGDHAEDFIPIVICKIPHSNPTAMTANLRGPIVVNSETRRGCQIVLANEDYAFDHPVFPEISARTATR